MSKNLKEIEMKEYDLITRILIGIIVACAFTIVIANVVMSIA